MNLPSSWYDGRNATRPQHPIEIFHQVVSRSSYGGYNRPDWLCVFLAIRTQLYVAPWLFHLECSVTLAGQLCVGRCKTWDVEESYGNLGLLVVSTSSRRTLPMTIWIYENIRELYFPWQEKLFEIKQYLKLKQNIYNAWISIWWNSQHVRLIFASSYTVG